MCSSINSSIEWIHLKWSRSCLCNDNVTDQIVMWFGEQYINSLVHFNLLTIYYILLLVSKELINSIIHIHACRDQIIFYTSDSTLSRHLEMLSDEMHKCCWISYTLMLEDVTFSVICGKCNVCMLSIRFEKKVSNPCPYSHQ